MKQKLARQRRKWRRSFIENEDCWFLLSTSDRSEQSRTIKISIQKTAPNLLHRDHSILCSRRTSARWRTNHQSHICGLRPHNPSSFSSKTFSKCRARSCRSGSRRLGRRFGTRSIRGITFFGRENSSRWSWNIFVDRSREWSCSSTGKKSA